MKANHSAKPVGFPSGLPDFLDALARIYRRIGLTPADARAAAFADAESFAPGPAEGKTER